MEVSGNRRSFVGLWSTELKLRRSVIPSRAVTRRWFTGGSKTTRYTMRLLDLGTRYFTSSLDPHYSLISDSWMALITIHPNQTHRRSLYVVENTLYLVSGSCCLRIHGTFATLNLGLLCFPW